MAKKNKKTVELDRLCICLESRINITVSKEAVRKLTPKFYHKSGTELRLEQKLLITTVCY